MGFGLHKKLGRITLTPLNYSTEVELKSNKVNRQTTGRTQPTVQQAYSIGGRYVRTPGVDNIIPTADEIAALKPIVFYDLHPNIRSTLYIGKSYTNTIGMRVSAISSLKEFNLENISTYGSQLTAIDFDRSKVIVLALSNNSAYSSDAFGQQHYSSWTTGFGVLNLSSCSKLTIFYGVLCNLTEVTLPNNGVLEEVNVASNKLSQGKINFPTSLKRLYLSHRLGTVSAHAIGQYTTAPSLAFASLSAGWSLLDLSACTQLTEVVAASCRITSINLPTSGITKLWLFNNVLTSVNGGSNFPSTVTSLLLATLATNANVNLLTQNGAIFNNGVLDISNCANLDTLACSNMGLTTLILPPQNTLRVLICPANKIHSINRLPTSLVSLYLGSGQGSEGNTHYGQLAATQVNPMVADLSNHNVLSVMDIRNSGLAGLVLPNVKTVLTQVILGRYFTAFALNIIPNGSKSNPNRFENTVLDFSGYTKLIVLSLSNCGLDMSNVTLGVLPELLRLTIGDCTNTYVPNLGLYTKLISFIISDESSLTSFTVNADWPTTLTSICLYNNTALTSINLTAAKAAHAFFIYNAPITTLDVGITCKQIDVLNCSVLTSITGTIGNLISFRLHTLNALTSLPSVLGSTCPYFDFYIVQQVASVSHNQFIDDVYANAVAGLYATSLVANRRLGMRTGKHTNPSAGTFQAPSGFVLGGSNGTPTTSNEKAYVLQFNYNFTVIFV